MDLQGSMWPGTFTISASSIYRSAVLKDVTNASGLGLGMALTGRGIPAGVNIVGIAEVGGTPGSVNVLLSLPATETGRGSYTITLTATAGGQGYIDTTYRAGKAFSWTNGENNSCDHCYEFGHQIGFYIGPCAGWTDLEASSSDGIELEDPNTFGIVLAAPTTRWCGAGM